MSETRQRKRLAWFRRHWVPIAIAVGIVGFLAVIGLSLWLGVFEALVPNEGEEMIPWPAVVVGLLAALAVGWAGKQLLAAT